MNEHLFKLDFDAFSRALQLTEELTWARGMWSVGDFGNYNDFTTRWLGRLSSYRNGLTREQLAELSAIEGSGDMAAAAALFRHSPAVLAERINAGLELPANFGSAEMEWTAAIYILVCSEIPGRWRALHPSDIGSFICRRANRLADTFDKTQELAIYHFPGFALDFKGLADQGCAVLRPRGSSAARFWLNPRGLRLCAKALGIQP